MYALRLTWNEVFRKKTLFALDYKINRELDPKWPVCLPPTVKRSKSLPSTVKTLPSTVKPLQRTKEPTDVLNRSDTSVSSSFSCIVFNLTIMSIITKCKNLKIKTSLKSENVELYRFMRIWVSKKGRTLKSQEIKMTICKKINKFINSS